MSYKPRIPRYDIRFRREELKLTLSEVARRAQCDLGLISNIEKGRRLISIAVAPRLAEVLGMEIIDLLYPKNDPKVVKQGVREEQRKVEAQRAALEEQLRQISPRKGKRTKATKETPATEVA